MTRSKKQIQKNIQPSNSSSPLASPSPSINTTPQSPTSHTNEYHIMLKKEMFEAKEFFKKELEKHMNQLRKEIKELKDENIQLKQDMEAIQNVNTMLEVQLTDLAQYERRNNIEIVGIEDDVEDDLLEDSIIKIADFMGVNIDYSDMEACHRLPKARNKSLPKRTIVRFVNRKHAEVMKKHSKKLRNLRDNKLGFKHGKVYVNENFCSQNKNIWLRCREIQKAGLIDRYSSLNGCVSIKLAQNSPWMKIKHVNVLHELFPDFSFSHFK